MPAMTVAAPTMRTRLLLCTSGGLFGALVMRRLAADPRVELVGVVLSSRVFCKNCRWLDGVRAHYERSGLRYLLYLWAATGLADLLGRFNGMPSVHTQAVALGCPVHETRDINDARGRAFVEACAPDLLVSSFFNQRIGAPLFDLPSAGAVNIHPSLLPALKGVDPVFYAKLRGITPIGVTLHRLAAELDTGPVLAQSQVAQGEAESVLRATAKLFARGADLLLEQLDAIRDGAAGQTQAALADYDSWPTPLQVRALRLSGQRLVRMADIRDLLVGRFRLATAA
jgi:methionyl-tRNA formyltransferase